MQVSSLKARDHDFSLGLYSEGDGDEDTHERGQVVSPVVSKSAYKISSDGRPVVLPAVDGIAYNVRVGDPASHLEADHIETYCS